MKRYPHDCKRCIFLGQFGEYDLYYHPSRTKVLKTVIARYGEDGDYLSGLIFALNGTIPALVEALKRAKAKGYYEKSI